MPDPDLVELTRRSMQLANNQDFGAAVEVFAPDAVFDVSEAGVGPFEGQDAVRSYLEDWIGSFEHQEYKSWEGIEMGGGVVFVVAELAARPAGTTASVRERWAFTVLWREGAIARVSAGQEIERARDEARALAGQAPHAPSGQDAGALGIARDAVEIWRRTGEPAWGLTRGDVEVRDHDIMDAGEYRGREGVERWLADWESAWSDFTMDAEQFIDAGDGVVVVFVRMRATGRGSAASVERDDAIVYRIRDGLIAELDYFNNRGEALAAAGISPR